MIGKEKVLKDIKKLLNESTCTFVGTSAIAMQMNISYGDMREMVLELEKDGKIAKWNNIDDLWTLKE